MRTPLNGLTLINLFVDDLPSAKAFYEDVFGLESAFDSGDDGAAYKLGNVIVNLLTDIIVAFLDPRARAAMVAGP